MRHRAVILTLLLASACGGGSGTSPVTVAPTVATVTVTPAAAVNFATVGRTVVLSAQAKDAASAVIASATITWSSTNPSVATVSGTGLVTAVANGAAGITAASGGITSAAVAVTVAQLPAAIVMTPTSVAFGALGKTRLITAVVNDSLGTLVPGTAVTWSRTGPGTVASVSVAGLATALAVGVGDTAVATLGALVGKTPITVTQVVASVAVTSTSATPDTLFTSTRTRTFSAAANDSNSNAIASAVFVWASSATAVATVNALGLVTAGTLPGTTTIQATTAGVTGSRPMIVRHYPATFTILPTSAAINTSAGTKLFTGTAQDSVSTNLTISWLAKNILLATVSPATGATTTATAVANGVTYVIMTSGVRSDSAALTISGQGVAAPSTITVNIGDFFFTSVRNGTTNPAVDTLAVGGTVTWNWSGSSPHSVFSTGSTSFTGSTTQTGPGHAYNLNFTTAGTYTYVCGVHGASMSGTVVVR